jgi:hypothetical protein
MKFLHILLHAANLYNYFKTKGCLNDILCFLLLRHASRSVCHYLRFCFVGKADGQSSISKPKNARSKRALEAREPKEVEDPRTVIFVRGTHTGEVVNGAMKDLVCGSTSND